MATFPSYVKLGWRDHAEKPTPVVVRSEMERGVARQRRTHADSLVTVPVTAYFDTAADSLAFETWFFGDAAAGAAWFNFTLPRTGTVTQARVVGGDIGSLKPSTKNWAFSERTFQLEYVRPGFIQLAPGLHTVDASRILSVQRNSIATSVDDAGVLQTAAANVLRYQGGQVLVEAESTNHLLHSQAINNAAWTGCSVSAAAEVYRGLAPFWTVAKTTAVSSESRGQNAKNVSAGESGTVTIALLAGTSTQCSVGILHNNPTGWGLDAESSAAVVEGPGAITARGGSLCTVTGLSATVPTLLRITRTFADVGTTTLRVYPGVHTSTTVGHSVKCTRAQYEAAANASSYIPTSTAASTRAADIVTVAA